MPIKNLTDRSSVTPRFRTLGKLRKGGEKVAKGYGPDLDHFRFTSDDPGIVQAFIDVYGNEPHALNVYLPYPTTEQNFPTWKELWTAGGLQHRCDGETCTIWLGSDGKYHRDPKPCPGGCDEVGRLEIIIPELIAAGYVGTVTMETHSLNDMIAITQVLLKTEELSNGDLRRVQFTLRRVSEHISVPGWGDNKGKRQRVEKWLVKIEPAVDWAQAQMALSRADERPALTASESPTDLDCDYDGNPIDDDQLQRDIAHAVEVVAEAKPEPKPESVPPVALGQYDATPFVSPTAATAWAIGQGAFGTPDGGTAKHARAAWDKATASANNTSEAAQLWRADVARRLAEKAQA